MRNRRKIQASVRNAAIFLAISAEFGSFYNLSVPVHTGQDLLRNRKSHKSPVRCHFHRPAKAWHEICRQYHHLCVFTGGWHPVFPRCRLRSVQAFLKCKKAYSIRSRKYCMLFHFPKIIRQCHESQTPSADTGFSLPGKRLRSPPKGLAHAVPRSVPSLPAAAVQIPD